MTILAINLLREGDFASALDRTTSGVIGVTTGVIVGGVAIATEILATVLGAILVAPETLATVGLGIVGYLSIEGIVNVTPETWSILVIVAFVAVLYGRDVVGEGA